MIDYLAQIDRDIFLVLHTLHRSSFADDVMWLLSAKWTWVPLYISLLYWLSKRFGLKRTLIWLAGISLAISCADQLCASVIRPAVERLRPANPDNPLSEFVTIVSSYRGGAYGFPSCHAANTFALTILFSCVARQRSIVISLCVWTLLNCYSRIYLGVHYPGDIIVGGIIGALSGFVWYLIASKVISYWRIPEQSTLTPRQNKSVPAVFVATLVIVVLISLF